ncbi:MAG: hypothetical protein GYB66_01275 [Chloroflexi bacterium]|nr:hypothetical protein [Chloroflexota bacterium]
MSQQTSEPVASNSPVAEAATSKSERYLAFAILTITAIVMIAMFRLVYPVGVDWAETYYPAMRHLGAPYAHSDLAGLPWILFFVPHALLPLQWGNALNIFLNISVPLLYIRVNQGGWFAILIVFTSSLFFDLARTNNVDWIPLVAFLLPPIWGLPLLLAKPQAVGGAALIWWKRQRFSVRMLAPMVVIIVAAIVIWGTQPIDGIRDVNPGNTAWNFAPWPFFIPLGLYLLYRGFKDDDEVLAAAATPFMVPYLAPYSLVALLTVIACKYRREALYIHLAFWMHFIVYSRRLEIILNECGC